MGCLIEIFFEIFIEGIFEIVWYCYTKLVQLIVPDKIISARVKKIIGTVFGAVLVLALIIGLSLWVQEDPFIKNIGIYMTYISFAIIVIQIILGIFVRVLKHFKK